MSNNYSYFPVIFNTESDCVRVQKALEDIGVIARRYFYPSVNEMKIFQPSSCPISEGISRRILCLPCHDRVNVFDVGKITQTIIDSL